MQIDRTLLPKGCLALFGLPFLVAGLFVLLIAAKSWWTYFDSADWTSTPAEILSVELENRQGNKGRSYSVACRYRYVVAGKAYESENLGVTGYGTSDRDLHQQRFQSLEGARSRQVPWPALVNPSDPAQALLLREVDLSMFLMPLLGLLVGGAGAGLMVFGLGGSRRGSSDPAA